ncbi:MAG: DUF2922 domain-containing protein [Bacillota bacterium]|nr:DUF2922 domain-containing protein [Bacillota bacterium]
MITKRLELLFVNNLGRRVTIALPEPREDLTAIEIEDAMNTIIAQNVFDSPGGDLVAIQGARVVVREVNEFDMLVN